MQTVTLPRWTLETLDTIKLEKNLKTSNGMQKSKILDITETVQLQVLRNSKKKAATVSY
jgi:hypothetical protein